ncbi:MAG: TylF/MycF/NovP-related O-methyltransferase [Bacteroidia bacterium]
MLQQLRFTYVRIKWFFRNFRKIRYNSEIFNNLFGPTTYNWDGLATSSNADFMKDQRFMKAYESAKNTNPWPNFTLQWRIHVVCWCANQAMDLEGDFVECGVNTGAYARAIMEYTAFNNSSKTFHLLDTYQGLDEKYITEEEKKYGVQNYTYRNTYEEVKKTFASFRANIIKGSVPETLPQCNAEKICYLSIDMNNVVPEIAAIEYFWDKIVPHGFILLDDYGFPAHITQKKAFDKFAASVNHEILTLPTGQGLIIKRSK